jgi:ABC-2 type transport system ATP-binding protein
MERLVIRYTRGMNRKAVIEIADLKKTFPGKGKKKTPVEAVRGVSFTIPAGEIFGLLGPNGAGKTTTMRMLCTLITPTSGKALVAGMDLADHHEEIRTKIGYVSQIGGMQRESSGRENLMLQARLYGMGKSEATARVAEILSLLNIESFADRRTSTYSGGQRRIFDLAAGIVHRPEILFLDEPSTGLDPQNRAHVWEQVKKLHDRGTSVFLTTHYLDEADALCDRVAIVDRGTIVAMGSPDELKRQISGDIVNLGFANDGEAKSALKILSDEAFIRESNVKDGVLQLFVTKGDENLPIIVRKLHEKGVSARTIGLSRPTLDDVFLKLTGRSLRESEGE